MNRIVMIVLKNIHRIPFITAKLYFYAAHPERYTKEQKYRLVRYLAERIKKTGNVEIQVFGKENIPKENGFIFYPNHQGMFDGVAILEALPMNREDLRQSAKVIQNVTDRVKRKENCLIFPEGTRSRNGNGLLEFKGGSFKAAMKAKCPIVPVALIDSFRPFDEKGTDQTVVQIHILKPLQYEEYQGMASGNLAALVREQIESVVCEA